MLPEDRKKHMAKFKNSDILGTILSVKQKNFETTKVTDGLSSLADAGLAMDKKGEKLKIIFLSACKISSSIFQIYRN